MRWLWAIIWLTGISWTSYLAEQNQFSHILIGVGLAFLSYLFLIREKSTFKEQLGLSIMGGILLIPSFPNLSDDIYRYLWDGLCWLEGINPYALTPAQAQEVIQRPDLITAMNSSDYFALYPMIPQMIFAGLAWISGGDIVLFTILFKITLLGSFVASAFVMKWTLKSAKIDGQKASWFLLNPLLVIETFGNAHFEILMIFFLLVMIHYALQNAWFRSGIAMAGAIASKLIPAMYVPILFFRSHQKGQLIPYLMGLSLSALLFTPILLTVLSAKGFGESANLFFTNFEFNASVYYICRWLGYIWLGYNGIQWIGPGLSFIAFVMILSISWRYALRQSKDWLQGLFLISVIYLICSTTVHPWYVLIPLTFGTLAGRWWILVWSFTVFFSYAYYDFGDTAGLFWVAAEYLVLIPLLLLERKKKPVTQTRNGF